MSDEFDDTPIPIPEIWASLKRDAERYRKLDAHGWEITVRRGERMYEVVLPGSRADRIVRADSLDALADALPDILNMWHSYEIKKLRLGTFLQPQ